MLPPFLGALLLVGTAVCLAIALAAALLARSRGRPDLGRWALFAAGGIAAVYGAFWLLGVTLAPTTVLPPGKSLSFCGLDCHLHVSVGAVRTEPYFSVIVHVASDAKAAPEWPGKLRYRLRNAAGLEMAPTNQIPDLPLEAGANRDFELRFAAPAAANGSTLVVTWDSSLDYLVPGAGNPLVQARRRLALPAAGET
jgi:hypothetical protein